MPVMLPCSRALVLMSEELGVCLKKMGFSCLALEQRNDGATSNVLAAHEIMTPVL
jgi:hypothetical protein